jgi:L-lactate dehydrogenase complex protein LldG
MSKADIIKSIRNHRPVFPSSSYDFSSGQPPLPPVELRELFLKSLKTAGAEVVEICREDEASPLSGIAFEWPGVLDFSNPETFAEYSASCDLEKADKIEHALFTGRFGVAENGAIWLEDNDLPQRILPFITQHLILKLDVNRIVTNMQEAYRLVQSADFGFGVFISGPSKTADIEQSLVYGAHGAKELTVILVNCPVCKTDY